MNDWFRLQGAGSGALDDPYRPDFKGHDVDGWGGNKHHPDSGPPWVVRVYGDSSTLDSLAAEDGCQRLNSVPTDALNQMFNQNRTDEGWKEGFQVG